MGNNSFTPGQIREMLDLSRSALRYYIRKGLLDVEKNDENGYHTFTSNNLSDLRDISYLRQMLDFSIDDIQDCFNAVTPDDYESVFTRRKALLESEIAQKQLQRDRRTEWEKYLSRLKRTPDSISIVEFEPFVFSPTVSLSLDKLPLLCSSFKLENGEASFGGYGYCFDEPLNSDAKQSNVIHFPAGKYIYAMCKSEYGMDNPEILSPILKWAEERKYSVRGPIQVDYFFRIKENAKYQFYYAITIPFSDCEISMEP